VIERGLHHDALDANFRLRNSPDKRESEHYRQAMVKRRAARAAVLATLEELRIDALAYPTLRRKPAAIGDPQAGSNCLLSATTGLPAMSMPAGFTTDGLPIGLELLGPAWSEATLLKYAYAWEQATKPRRAPFSTPPLVKGAAPAPLVTELQLGLATVKLNFDRTTGVLRYDVTTANLVTTDRVIGLAIHRTNADKPGPVIAHLLAPSQISGSGTLILRGRDREDMAGGRLFARLYTRQAPLGLAGSRISF
jgi:hypothetical protein